MSDKNVTKIITLKNKFSKLEVMQGKRAELMKELERSTIYELCTYDVRPDEVRKGRFFLFEISTKKMVADGTVTTIMKWINRRKIDINLVYNHEILDK
jgi:hypothetical protein